MTINPFELKNSIIAAGLPVQSLYISEDMELEDHSISLTSSLHVQVGYDYMVLVEEADGGLVFNEVQTDFPAIIADIERNMG